MPYEFFEHTADVGIRACAAALPELFEQMARGLVELIAEDSSLEAKEVRAVSLTAEDVSLLLWRWLEELLFWCSTDRFLPVQYRLEQVTPTAIQGTVIGDRFDPARHVQGREVKAVTRHLLQVEQRDGLWHGQVIVDI
ncbi:MAG: archease [Candidatus Omnitrophica bacterium]|nr:archease [Candidatus Omnitrophota bacterium]